MPVTEVTLDLKKELINYNNKPIKNVDDIKKLHIKNPTFDETQLVELCPSISFGDILPNILINIKSQDPKEQLKLFRLASKITDKMITAKGHLVLDVTQLDDLYDLVAKSESTTTVKASILIHLQDLKDKLKN